VGLPVDGRALSDRDRDDADYRWSRSCRVYRGFCFSGESPTPDNKLVICPNSSIWGSSITNYSAMATRRVDMVVGISYSADISEAKTLISGVLAGDDLVLSDPEPVVEVVEMADSSINLVVRPWCKTEDYWAVYFKMNHELKDLLDKNGIEIPFPQMDVHHHNDSENAP
jgi:small conductance mechanosensitive channel